jgi:structure-specific recognition protein 1
MPEDLVPMDCYEHFQRVWVALDGHVAERDELVAGLKRLQRGNLTAADTVAANSNTTAVLSEPIVVLDDFICTMPDVSFTSPRGLFNVDFGENVIQVQGKAGTFTITPQQIQSILVLEEDPKTNTSLIFFRLQNHPNPCLLVSVKGNNSGKFKTVVMGTSDMIGEELLRKMNSEQTRRDDLFQSLVSLTVYNGKKIFRNEDLSRFKSAKGNRYLSCNYKHVNEGKLYLFEHGMLFVGSPLQFLPRQQIESVNAMGSNSRTFEIHVKMLPSSNTTDAKGGKKPKRDEEFLEFSQIAVEECPAFENYLKMVKFGQHGPNKAKKELTSPEGSSTTTHRGSSFAGDVEEDDDDDDSLSSDDSMYTSSEESEAAGSEEGGGEEGGEPITIEDDDDDVEQVEVIEGEEGSSGEEGTEDSSSEDSDDDSDDGNIAELVEEDKFEPDPQDLVIDGRKRRRT